MTQDPIAEARRLIAVPPGQAGSGRIRYGAAMTLNRAGLLSDEALEVYRICSPLDSERPAEVLAARGLAAEIIVPVAADAGSAVGVLIDEIDRYLSALPGPGVGEVRVGIAAARTPAIAPQPPRASTIVGRWLAPALAALERDDRALAHAIAAAAPALEWVTYDGYPRDRIGATFADGHAFASVIGSAGPVAAENFDLGLFLIAPHVLYRDHRHKAPELYAPLTGPHGWRFSPGAPLVIRPAHQPVWNDPFTPHATKVGPVPFLCIFAWTRDVDDIAEVIPADDWPALEALRLVA